MSNIIESMNYADIDKVRWFETFALQFPQVPISTSHVFHAGMYARTIMIPSGTILTGALIKIPTLVIITGNVHVFTGDKTIEIHGYDIISASAGRKQVFHAIEDSYVTMIFTTDSKTIEDAENEFTDEVDMLLSRKNIEEA